MLHYMSQSVGRIGEDVLSKLLLCSQLAFWHSRPYSCAREQHTNVSGVVSVIVTYTTLMPYHISAIVSLELHLITS